MGLVMNISFYKTPIFPAQVLNILSVKLGHDQFHPISRKGSQMSPQGFGMDYR